MRHRLATLTVVYLTAYPASGNEADARDLLLPVDATLADKVCAHNGSIIGPPVFQ